MASEDITSHPDADQAPARRFEDLPPAAQRALKEAEARRAEVDRFEAQAEAERGGRGGARDRTRGAGADRLALGEV